MIEKMTLGSTPVDEDCAQVGVENYTVIAHAECSLFKDQLIRAYHDHFQSALPTGLRLRIKGAEHEYGTYYEVTALFESDDEPALKAAIWLENNLPSKWDAKSLESFNTSQQKEVSP